MSDKTRTNLLTLKQCIEQFRLYAADSPSKDSKHSLMFCANFLEEMLKPKEPSELPATPCSVERTPKSVIEKKLLAALDDDDKVAILASKQDLEDMVTALYGLESHKVKMDFHSWCAHKNRCEYLAAGMSQLLREAFPPNADIRHGG